MAPAAVTQLAAFLGPWFPEPPESVAASDFAPSAILFVGVSATLGFIQWFCAASLMCGVSAMSLGQPTQPISWLSTGLKRWAALATTFLIPVAAAAVLWVPLAFTMVRLNQIISGIRFITPLSLDFQLEAMRYEMLGALLIFAVGIPFAWITTAEVILGQSRLLPAAMTVLRACFSRAGAARFLGLSASIYALWGVFLGIAALAETIDRFFPNPRIVANTIEVVAGVAVGAFIAVVVALARSEGYLPIARRPEATEA